MRLPAMTNRLFFSRIFDLPQCAPALASVVGVFPIPIELIRLDIEPDHALFAFLTAHNGVAAEDHPVVFESACEVQIGAVIIHPGLAPQVPFRVID